MTETENPWGAAPDPEPEAATASAETIIASTKLCKRLKACAFPVLAGHDSLVQGLALAELSAAWLAGHDPDVRDALFETHMQAVHSLIEICEMEMFGPAGHPARNEGETTNG